MANARSPISETATRPACDPNMPPSRRVTTCAKSRSGPVPARQVRVATRPGRPGQPARAKRPVSRGLVAPRPPRRAEVAPRQVTSRRDAPSTSGPHEERPPKLRRAPPRDPSAATPLARASLPLIPRGPGPAPAYILVTPALSAADAEGALDGPPRLTSQKALISDGVGKEAVGGLKHALACTPGPRLEVARP